MHDLTSLDEPTAPAKAPPVALATSVAAPGWHYRLRNLRFTLFEQIAGQLDIELPHLAAYNRAPHNVARLIADDCDLRPESVRRCLRAVLDGTPVASRNLAHLLASGERGWGRMQGRARADRLIKDRTFDALCRNINHARAVIVHRW